MSAPVYVNANFSDLRGSDMLPVLEEVFKSQLERHPDLGPVLFRIKQARHGIYQYSEVHDLPLAQVVPEGTDYSYFAPDQGSDETLSVVKYGLGVSISEEAIRDMKFDTIADSIRKLAESNRESQEVSYMNIFNNGFSSEKTADSKSIFNTAHTLPGGRTFANRPSAEVDLSPESLKSALTDFETNFIGSTGIKKKMRPDKLIVPTALRFYAKEILESAGLADTADNNMNSLKGEGIQVVSSPHLTDSDAWFLASPKEKTTLTIARDMGIETKSQEVFDNDSIKYKSRYREKVGVLNPYGLWGTTGI